MVLYFTSRCLAHFEVTLVKNAGSVGFFLFCFVCMQIFIQLFQLDSFCWKHYLCFTELLLFFCQRSVDYTYITLFSSSNVLSILSLIPYCVDYCTFIVSRKVELYQFSDFVLLQGCVGYSSFPITVPFVSSLALDRTSSTVLKKKGDTGPFCIVSDLSRKVLSFILLNMILPTWFL